MKHLIRYIMAAVLGLSVLASCSDDDPKAPEALSLDKTELTVGADGASEELNVVAPSNWYASTDQPWVSVSPATGIGNQKCTILIDSTLINDVRTATVRFTADDMTTQVLKISQTGYGNIIHTDSTTLSVKASQRDKNSRYFDIMVTTNVAFDITIKYAEGTREWIEPQETDVTLDLGARPRTAKLRFNWVNNPVPEERKAEIIFTPKDPSQKLEKPASVIVTQQAARRIEDNREGDSLALIAIAEALDVYTMWDTSENLGNWENVRLWEKSDKALPCPEAIGRVRDARFMITDTNEPLPAEVKYLKYIESLAVVSNVNSFLKTIDLGTDVCDLKHLRSLEVFAYGLVDLPQELTRLGGTLESLKIGGNNFNTIPSILTKENFPKLRILEMQACRRWTLSDLRHKNDNEFEGGIGLHFNTNSSDDLKKLLLWDTLEELVLSYNYIEGQLPDFQVGKDGVEAWTQEDVDAFGGDTIQYLVGKPKILPHAKHVTLNLNFFTGKAPDWLLYHPHLLDWVPEQLIFNQMEYGINSEGQVVRFSNTPNNYEYYFEAFPLYRTKYEVEEEYTDEE